MVTVGDLLERSGCSEIGLLKIDIEGSELELFSEGADEWLPSVAVMNIELHDRLREGCSEAFHGAVAEYEAELIETVHNVIWANRSSSAFQSARAGA